MKRAHFYLLSICLSGLNLDAQDLKKWRYFTTITLAPKILERCPATKRCSPKAITSGAFKNSARAGGTIRRPN